MNETTSTTTDETRVACALTDEAEYENALVRRVQAGGADAAEALDTLCEFSRGRVIGLANRYRYRTRRVMDVEDLEQEACAAMIETVFTYDPDLNDMPWGAYAWERMKWRVSDALRFDPLVSLPKDECELHAAAKALRAEGEEVTVDALAEALAGRFSRERVRLVLAAKATPVSLDQERASDEEETEELYNFVGEEGWIGSGVSRPTEEAALDAVEREMLRRAVEEAVESLGEKEAAVVRGRLAGLGYREIAETSGTTAKRCADDFKRAKRKLRDVLEGWAPLPSRGPAYKGIQERRGRHGTRWQAMVRAHGRTMALGTFDTPEEAARAYDRAALRYYQQPRLNFPGEAVAA